MNEKLNLVEILKDCPEGTKLYSTVFGEVKLCAANYDNAHPINIYPICVKDNIGNTGWLTSNGKFIEKVDGECILFPSKDQRDWSKFKVKQPKFDPKTLQPYMKVLVRDNSSGCWEAQLFSHIIKDEAHFPYACINNLYKYCIPYNDDTKHLVGTTEEAPEFYRYWED